jgi:lipopolysaccharide biosynthesis glycosyltransferase
MDIIKKSPFYKGELIRFEVIDGYGSVEKACKARLDLFDLLVDTMNKGNKYNYQKILYLDTDIIVKGDLKAVFELCQKDKLYVLEEGTIDSYSDFWGKTLFVSAGDLELYINNTAFSTAFSTGIMLFNNSEKMKCFFLDVKKDMIARPFTFYCQDQPYIVYNAFKYALYDNQALKPFAVNNDHDINSSKIIHHFPGDPGWHQNKMAHMIRFLMGLKNISC